MTRPVALVTGASAGIGAEFVRRLAARGHDVVAVARDEARLAAQADEVGAAHGVTVTPFPCDLASLDGIHRLADHVRGLPRLDVLVNNAGFGTRGLLHEADVAAQEAMLLVHVVAPSTVTQAALPGMLARGSGSIINVSSVASFLFSRSNVNYCATKAYLRVFSEGLAAELAGTGVYGQALCPGFFRSEFHQRMQVDVSSVPRSWWMTAGAVAEASLRAMDRRGPVVVVPGLLYQVIALAAQLIPRSWIGARAARVHERRAAR